MSAPQPPPLPASQPSHPPQPHPPTLLPLKFKWPEPDRSNIATHCCYFPGSKYIVKIRHIQKAAAAAAAVAVAAGEKKEKGERSHGSVLPPPRCHPFNKYFNRPPTRLGLVEEAGEHPNGAELVFRLCLKKKKNVLAEHFSRVTTSSRGAVSVRQKFTAT